MPFELTPVFDYNCLFVYLSSLSGWPVHLGFVISELFCETANDWPYAYLSIAHEHDMGYGLYPFRKIPIFVYCGWYAWSKKEKGYKPPCFDEVFSEDFFNYVFDSLLQSKLLQATLEIQFIDRWGIQEVARPISYLENITDAILSSARTPTGKETIVLKTDVNFLFPYDAATVLLLPTYRRLQKWMRHVARQHIDISHKILQKYIFDTGLYSRE